MCMYSLYTVQFWMFTLGTLLQTRENQSQKRKINKLKFKKKSLPSEGKDVKKEGKNKCGGDQKTADPDPAHS